MPALHFFSHNQLTLLHNGEQFHPALLGAIENASSEIILETYIFSADDVGQAIQRALQQAAQRGVRVYVISDWHGTGRERISSLRQSFATSGVSHRTFNPWFWHGLTRTHRKLCVIDQRIAFVGGMNLNSDYICDFDPEKKLNAPRWDFTAQIEGPLVHRIWLDTRVHWARLGHISWIERLRLARQLKRSQPLLPTRPPAASFAVRDNWANRNTIQRAYLQALGNARHSVWLATPYFAPGRKLRRALTKAAERGVRVTLVLGTGQFALQDAVARAFYPRLLKSGVEVREYQISQLHGKVAVIDDDWATVGSSNCDGLSLFLNQEANLVIRDSDFADQLRQYIAAAAEISPRISLRDFDQLPWYRRAWYEVAFWGYLGLMRLVTWGEYT
jgi:cardiolipin synthase